jgi:FkbM family methyltransferase
MRSLWKPWYVYRPGQMLRRITRSLRKPPGGLVKIQLPWGVAIHADPAETIGRSLWTTGIYDLAVSELLCRITLPGETVVDAGANIGYMTSILAVRAGPNGRVLSFEPHPTLAERLRQNAAEFARNGQSAPIEVHQVALSDRIGTANLECPEGFAGNQGIGFLSTTGKGVSVPTAHLDGTIGEGVVSVMKLDVEGHEPAVLRGSSRLLAERRLRPVVFEEHRGPRSETCRILLDAGYTLLQVGWTMNGLILADLSAPPVCKPYEAPSYLATTSPDDVIVACSKRGWRILA